LAERNKSVAGHGISTTFLSTVFKVFKASIVEVEIEQSSSECFWHSVFDRFDVFGNWERPFLWDTSTATIYAPFSKDHLCQKCSPDTNNGYLLAAFAEV
jgi:hypothetical protein